MSKRKRDENCTLLGISGKIGSGKSTLAQGIKTRLERQGWLVLERNFADKLKELVAYHYAFDVALCYSQEGKNSLLPPITDVVEYRRTFTDKLKALVAFHFGFDVAQFDTAEKTLLPPRYGDNMSIQEMLGLWQSLRLQDVYDGTTTVGRALQLWGTALRNVDEQLWIKSVADFIESKTAQNAASDKRLLFIVPDTRFPNEAAWLRDNMGGVVVRLNGDPGRVAENSQRDLQHVSETALDNYAGFNLVLDTNALDVEQCVERVLRAL